MMIILCALAFKLTFISQSSAALSLGKVLCTGSDRLQVLSTRYVLEQGFGVSSFAQI